MGNPGLLLVISGPSGTGKGTICKELLADNSRIQYSVSATTRSPREGEIDGVNYFFLSKETFEEMRVGDEFLEWARVYENFYGTPRKPVEEALAQGIDVILEIDIQGALQIRQKFPSGVFIFILPPSLQELKARIVGRATDTMDVIEKRLNCVEEELGYVNQYDYVIINDNIPDAVSKLEAIIKAEKCRAQRKCYDIR